MMKRIAVVMGGTSHEASVSLLSGESVFQALVMAGYHVTQCVLDRDSIEDVPRDVDAVFIALHGGYGEGGQIQADLNAIGMPYTGPGTQASSIAMDKLKTHDVLGAAGIAMPPSIKVTIADAMGEPMLDLPLVVKPPRDGSSVGLSLVRTPDQWANAVRLACEADGQGEAIVESYIAGREWAVSVVNGRALPVVEIRAPGGWYDYHAKYVNDTTEYVFPKETDLTHRAQVIAVDVCRVMGCRNVSRVDFRIDDAEGIYVLEVNTIPGCTSHSLLPMAALHAEITFPALCAELVEHARCDDLECIVDAEKGS